MSNSISAGAYVIRNKGTRTVLHLVNPGPSGRDCTSDVVAFEQDENGYHDQQIWWVEPVADMEGVESGRGGPIYTISNPCSRKALHMSGGAASLHKQQGIEINAATYHGVSSTLWRLQRADVEDGDYYHITSVYNGQLLDINGSSGAACHSQNHVPGYAQHCWEFITPVVGIPAGWFHIQNAGTGHLLSHKYLHHPPVLVKAPNTQQPSQYLEGWKFQWTLYHSKLRGSGSAKNSWIILNRLTRATLINKTWETEDTPGSICAWTPHGEGIWEDGTWRLEFDPSGNWKIINTRTSCLLEQTQVKKGPGMGVVCVDQKFTTKGGDKSWLLRPPILETDDESPPDYPASQG